MKNLREIKCKRYDLMLNINIDNAITDLKFGASPKKINANRKYLKYLLKDGSVEKFKIVY